jgi:hypothetical protein
MAKPLMNGLLLQKETSSSTTLSTPLKKAGRDIQDTQDSQDTQDIDGWASAVKWSTPRKIRELDNQLRLFTQLDQTIATQRQLFKKVKKGFQEQSLQLATT